MHCFKTKSLDFNTTKTFWLSLFIMNCKKKQGREDRVAALRREEVHVERVAPVLLSLAVLSILS